MKLYLCLGLLLLARCRHNRPVSSSVMDTTTIYASVVLAAPSGQSILDTTPRADRIDQLRPDSATVAKVEERLKTQGFTIGPPGVTIAISGPQSLFESTFDMRLTPYRQDGQTYYKTSKPATIPASLQPSVRDVVLAEPTQYFH
ncbi:MAG: hypothetical protein H7319_13590 [Spirosoma sp.]|nr:hypothetical protein [Spirosoma sp.]